MRLTPRICEPFAGQGAPPPAVWRKALFLPLLAAKPVTPLSTRPPRRRRSARRRRQRRRRGRNAGRDQDQRGKHRRGVGGDAEQANVAVLDAVVPDIEGEADRPEAEAEDRQPLRRRSRERRSISKAAWQAAASAAVTRQKPATASVGACFQAARQHRIARPDEGAAQGQAHSRRGAGPLAAAKARALARGTASPRRRSRAPRRRRGAPAAVRPGGRPKTARSAAATDRR